MVLLKVVASSTSMEKDSKMTSEELNSGAKWAKASVKPC
jgi:hypothetical protein